jgi:hypothetical protein
MGKSVANPPGVSGTVPGAYPLPVFQGLLMTIAYLDAKLVRIDGGADHTDDAVAA